MVFFFLCQKENTMADCGEKKDGKCCEKPKDPKECSEEQIKKCHGDNAVHPCEDNCCEEEDNKE